MSLPAKNEKGYLEIIDQGNGLVVTAFKQHASDLEPLFRQNGIRCQRKEGAKQDTLLFDAGVDRKKVEEVLQGYEAAKGS
jgi:hypothetical protein